MQVVEYPVQSSSLPTVKGKSSQVDSVQAEFFQTQSPNPEVTWDVKQTLDPLDVKLLHAVYTSLH